MKLQTTTNEITQIGATQAQAFSMRTSRKMFEILSGLYSDTELAIVRELSCNAVDAHVMAGKETSPFHIHLPNALEPWLVIQDFGTGISHQNIYDIYTVYGASTKENTNSQIGCLGLGSKSPFAYSDNFIITSIVKGEKRIYNAFFNEQNTPSVALLSTEETTEPNGLSVQIPVKAEDFYKFQHAVEKALRFFAVKPTVSGGSVKWTDDKWTFEGTGWKSYTSFNYSECYAVMGGVAYLASGPTQALTAVVLFTGVSFRLLPVVNRVQVLALTIIGEMPAAKLIFEMPSKAADLVAEQPQETSNVLEMLGVNFQYSDSGAQVLRDISLRLERGKQYAIVGPSGAGKTTLVDIFLGLLQPTSGAMRRDKVSVSAYVPQETHIAYMSLAENVALVWNRSDVDLSRVESALKRAGLHEFLTRIDDPTPLLNESLSGGQKQRIGLARAFYSGADFIVLDEVTSALDAETEKSVVEQIYGLRGDVTAIIVAHRLSTVQHADHVFYLENGRLIGSDTFQALADTLPQFRQQIEFGQIELRD